ncbi:MAG: transcriptional regulator [Propionibacteriaceae bacterium]|nr:transcriptional regulator [Propionibacteriaceae bacterium]
MDTQRLGPAPADAGPLSPARARVASTLVDLGPRVSLSTLAEHLGGHPNATRQHLEALVDAGHATVSTLPAGGPGRPAQVWSLTASGRRALAADAIDTAYGELVDALAERLADRPDARAEARAIGRAWGQRRRERGLGSVHLLDLLDELGFAPEAHPTDAGTTRLLACPILASARAHPEVICAIHAGLVEGALGPDADVRLVPFAEPGACLLNTR